jgi:hypothetical protein
LARATGVFCGGNFRAIFEGLAMSSSAVVDAWQAEIPPLQKLVLLALADGVSCDGSLGFDVAPLSLQCSMVYPVLVVALDGLEDRRWIEYRIQSGRLTGRLIGYGERAA